MELLLNPGRKMHPIKHNNIVASWLVHSISPPIYDKAFCGWIKPNKYGMI